MISSLIPDDLFSAVSFPINSRKLLVAYSGGLDSHVLLHLYSDFRHSHGLEISAIHVNHGLSENAPVWAEHCRSVCEDLKVSFRLVELDARAPRGESPEAWARHRRYEAIEHLILEDDVLLTAHHMDDTAETLLIQLFRGAGPAGLASMPVQSRFGKGWHFRPLLAYNRTQLRQYAIDKGLVWVEDESNLDTRYDRNFLRNNVLPVLRQRWPSVSRTLSRAARHQAEAAALLDDLANSDLEACARNNRRCLSASALQRMTRARAGNTIRFWIKTNGFPVPSETRLAQIFSDVLAAQPDSEPCVKWNGIEVRRYRDDMFITTPLPEPPLAGEQYEWDIHTICKLKLGDLYAFRTRGEGIKTDVCDNKRLTVRFRSGGETVSKGSHHQDLKKLFQQQGIPPCYRDYVPLIYLDDRLILIAGLFVDDDFKATPDEDSWNISWTSSDHVCLDGGG